MDLCNNLTSYGFVMLFILHPRLTLSLYCHQDCRNGWGLGAQGSRKITTDPTKPSFSRPKQHQFAPPPKKKE